MTNQKNRIGIIGATGYVGMELVRLLSGHRRLELTTLVSQSYIGKRFSEVYPAFTKICDLVLRDMDLDAIADACDIVITALPHGVSATVVPELLSRGVRVVDHSGDFRYRDVLVYEKAYKLTHPHPELLAEAVYGLPEFYRDRIATARLVANPGCYPTCSLLALKPLLNAGVIKTDGIIIDATSGVSGAGRKADLSFAYCETDESYKAYGVIGHRHTSEIEQEAGFLAGQHEPLAITFTPHLAPMKRGMLATIYADLVPSVEAASLHELVARAYEHDYFVRVLPAGHYPDTRQVAYTNFCDIAVTADIRTGKVKIISAIDNLGKGAAAQAIQAINLMVGLPENEGLTTAGGSI
ncbi:MAG: N-acetyl-gamma-glutamyl-phosphate reductase [Eubacteriales bacterium]|nr:N-acetyl-gamma-glutamyl-phosphate reductase [Eubacteriales bacterium]